MQKLKFKNCPEDARFLKLLRKRVNQYFMEHNIPKTGNTTSTIKAICLIAAYLILFISLFLSTTLTQLYSCYGLLGSITIFTALNIAHDAAHNTFSAEKKWNDRLLYTFDFLGASGYMWRLKHVHSHHPHVNIPGMDGDIRQTSIVRIFPNAPFLKLHKYQYLYMPILYGFYTLMWLVFRDFKDFFQTDISGKPGVQHSRKEYIRLFVGKGFFFGRMIGLPTLLLSFSLGQILLGFFIFHLFASYTVALALISAHVGEESQYPAPNAAGEMPLSWVRHQIVTTTDFATHSSVITHLFGGFNHHVVHHLFPNICHIHYPNLTAILRRTCCEFDVPYQHNKTLVDAALSHFRFLKKRSEAGMTVEYLEM